MPRGGEGWQVLVAARQLRPFQVGRDLLMLWGMAHVLATLRRAYARQVALQERHGARHDLSGRETLAAARFLRWRDGRLVGELLPPT